MIQEFQLRALPEQAISEQALKQFIGREKGASEGVQELKNILLSETR